jgi:hypothetical protein
MQGMDPAAANVSVFRGLFGAQSNFTTGRGKGTHVQVFIPNH